MSGVTSDGLSTTPLPAMSAMTTSPVAMPNGKFHGEMMPTTPRGMIVQVAAAVLEQVQRNRLGREDARRALDEVGREVGDDHDLHRQRLGARLARLGGDERAQLVGARDHEVAEAARRARSAP